MKQIAIKAYKIMQLFLNYMTICQNNVKINDFLYLNLIYIYMCAGPFYLPPYIFKI